MDEIHTCWLHDLMRRGAPWHVREQTTHGLADAQLKYERLELASHDGIGTPMYLVAIWPPIDNSPIPISPLLLWCGTADAFRKTYVEACTLSDSLEIKALPMRRVALESGSSAITADIEILQVPSDIESFQQKMALKTANLAVLVW